jgi:hypothetical protein
MGGVMAKKTLNIGMVGYGFMGRTHSNAFCQAPHFFDLGYKPVLKTICARSADKASAFAEQWGYQNSVTDWRALVDDTSIDLIDIASPNDTHMEIAIAAAEAGKMVMCEKPLGRNAAESRKMVEAVERAGVANMVWYNYRRVPAVAPSSCRTGPSRRTCRRAGRASGVSMPVSRAPASPAIFSPTASTPRCGSTAASRRSPA